MGRRMEAKEPAWIGTMDQSGDGQAIRFLAASEQFSTRSCARCAGLLVNDWCDDSSHTGKSMSPALRCVQCGHRIDAVILQNQIHHRSETSAIQQEPVGAPWEQLCWMRAHNPQPETTRDAEHRGRRMR